jgi:hypothetical protein
MQAFDHGLKAASELAVDLHPSEKSFGNIVLRTHDPRPDYENDLAIRKGSILYEKALVYRRQNAFAEAIASCTESLKIRLSHGYESLNDLSLLCELLLTTGNRDGARRIALLFQEALEARLELRRLVIHLNNIPVSILLTDTAAAVEPRSWKALRLSRLFANSELAQQTVTVLNLVRQFGVNPDKRAAFAERSLGGF